MAERRSLLTSWLQAGAAIVALAISTVAFVQQLRLNSQQVTLNDYARERNERKYSSRVAFWIATTNRHDSTFPAGLDVFIQNRSPTPLRNVHVLTDLTSGSRGDITLTDIPPCTIEAHRIAPPEDDFFVKSDNRIGGYNKLFLEFDVDNHRWRLTSEKLSALTTLASGSASPPSPSFRPQPTSRLINVPFDPGPAASGGQVEDCGEGG